MATTWKSYVFAHLPGMLDAVPAGQLEMREAGNEVQECLFGYGRRYLERPNALPVDPASLPLSCLPGNEQRYAPSVPPLFGAIRDAAPDLWGRRVIEAQLKVPANALPESTYLKMAGPHRFGALGFRDAPDAKEPAGVLPTPTELAYLLEAAGRIEEGLPIPDNLEFIFSQSSMGGARPKALVVNDGEQFLAKFPAKGDGFNVPVIEQACLELARKAGLIVPRTARVGLADGRDVMLIERFDRKAVPGGFAKTHCVSALTLLGKHTSESLGTPYAELAQKIGEYGVDGHVIEDRAELFARVAFSILVSNDDDHLRNHAFLWNAQGRGWRLTPLYDVVPRPQIARERLLHLSVGPQGRVATLDNLLQGHGDFGLLKPAAARIIDRVAGVVREWRLVFEELGVAATECDKVASAFRRPRDIGMGHVERYLHSGD